MEKIISVGKKRVGFKATASTLKRYRKKFNRDFIKDFRKLQNDIENNPDEISAEALECFERVAYIMAWQFDNTIPASPDDWLDEFEMFDIYQVLPEIVELWSLSTTELEKPKKKAEEVSEN